MAAGIKRVIVAFDSFKGCISAEEACDAAAEGIRSIYPDSNVVKLPLSDGGEGLVACIKKLLPTADVALSVHGPLMDMVTCSYVVSQDGKTAYMEMAAASGLTLVPEDRRNPVDATTYGVGEMIADAIDRGCERIVMGIGGSATCDAGEGMLKALRDRGHLDTPCTFVVACDVANPLYGEQGAAFVFAPQKGATPEQVILLDSRLRAFANKTEDAGIASADMADYPGAGAAGGLGYAFLTYLRAELQSGIDILLDIAGFDEMIRDADMVITGEGKSDAQTMMGKVPSGVLKRCNRVGVKTWLLSGAIDDLGCVLSRNFFNVQSINEGDSRPFEQLLMPEVAKENLRNTVKKVLQNE
ncbi:MAG: glycerate kinase [Prevotella sp.]